MALSFIFMSRLTILVSYDRILLEQRSNTDFRRIREDDDDIEGK